MYSQQQARPAPPAPAAAATPAAVPAAGATEPANANRYIKGRLPDGVDFSSYPGRSSTPLPTAESKSAERINQLKIWNEAATNDDKRRLNAKKGVSVSGSSSSTRRTDSFKDAKDRHSASFHAPPPSSTASSHSSPSGSNAANPPRNIRAPPPDPVASADMFADRSDSEDDADEQDDDALANNHHQHLPHQTNGIVALSSAPDAPHHRLLDDNHAPSHHVPHNIAPNSAPAPSATVPAAPPVPPPAAHVPTDPALGQHTHAADAGPHDSAPSASRSRAQQKDSKGACCIIM